MNPKLYWSITPSANTMELYLRVIQLPSAEAGHRIVTCVECALAKLAGREVEQRD